MTLFGVKWPDKDWYAVKTNQPTNQPTNQLQFMNFETKLPA